MDAGTTFKRKWMTKIHLVGANSGNVSAAPYAIRDLNGDGSGVKQMAPINYRENDTWGDARKVWGTTTDVWQLLGKLDLWRRFPQTTLRSDFMQIQLQPIKQAVYSSSGDYPTGCNAVINATAKTATIQTPSGYSSILWPLDILDYVIAFQTDGYVNEYTITALDNTSKIITYSDSANKSVTNAGGLPWVIRGIKKEQRPTITSLTVHYGYLGDKNQAYPGSTTASGAGGGGENPS
jgi:hypothetical protein